jgi:hypothetical protein
LKYNVKTTFKPFRIYLKIKVNLLKLWKNWWKFRFLSFRIVYKINGLFYAKNLIYMIIVLYMVLYKNKYYFGSKWMKIIKIICTHGLYNNVQILVAKLGIKYWNLLKINMYNPRLLLMSTELVNSANIISFS